MKKIVFLSLLTLCLPWMLAAQDVEDDLYYVPAKKKTEQKKEEKKTDTGIRRASDDVIVVETRKPVVSVASAGGTTVVVKDKKGNVRDVDEYNRRYDSKEYDFVQAEDTLYIEEKTVPDPDGEWVNGFEGSQDDYEYAMRIIRFRNPRYAISISSPLYWDVVYGLNSWDWNVYTDGLYAYAFPTFSNRLWWDWRYNWSWGWPYYGWNWGWNGFYFGWGGFYAGWTGWYGPGWGWHYPYYGPGWGWHHPHHSYWGPRNTYTARRSTGRTYNSGRGTVVNGGGAVRSSATRTYGSSSYQGSSRNGSTGVRRVVGTRSATGNAAGINSGRSSYSRDNAYTRPSRGSGTRVGTSGMGVNTNRGTYTRGSGLRSSGGATYSRGSSNSSTRSYAPVNNSNRRSSFNNSTRSGSSSSGSFRSGGGSSSRSYGGGGATRSGGGSRRR